MLWLLRFWGVTVDMQFVPSALLLLFSMSFFGIWLINKPKKSLLRFSLSFACFAIGLLVQNLEIPANKSANVLLSSTLYFSGAFNFAEGVLVRSRRHYSRWLAGIIISIFLIALAYLACGDSSYFILANTLNFGIGTILFAGCLQVLFLWHGNKVDRVFFIIFSLLPLHFFTRTFLTVSSIPDVSDPSLLVTSTFWNVINIMNSLVSVFIGLAILGLVTSDIISEISKDRDADPLSGLLNRRGLNRFMRSQSRSERLSILVIDIDNFKKINDRFGHPIGDATLIHFSNVLKSMRGAKAIARVGGEEFVLLLSGNAETVWHTADTLRERVANYNFPNIVDGYKITCSIGIAVIEENEDIWLAFVRADKGLLSAKQDGRNRVVTAGA